MAQGFAFPRSQGYGYGDLGSKILNILLNRNRDILFYIQITNPAFHWPKDHQRDL